MRRCLRQQGWTVYSFNMPGDDNLDLAVEKSNKSKIFALHNFERIMCIDPASYCEEIAQDVKNFLEMDEIFYNSFPYSKGF